MSKYDLIVFDADGTLTDTGKTHLRWMNDMNIRGNYELPLRNENDLNEIRRTMRSPMANAIRNYGFPENDVQELVKEYESKFKTDSRYRGRPFTGIDEVIKSLSSTNIAIVTANVCENVCEDLRYLANYFKLIIDKKDIDSKGWKKADALIWLKDSLKSKSPIYVGDTTGDKVAAETASWPFIWVDYGWEKPERSQISANVESLKKMLCE